MKRLPDKPEADDLRRNAGTRIHSPLSGEPARLRQLVSHLRENRTQLCEEWARRVTEAGLLTALNKEEIFLEATSLYDNYVAVLETGNVEAWQACVRNLSERNIPRGVATHEVVGIVLLWRDVLARSLFKKYQGDFAWLNRVLDASEPAADLSEVGQKATLRAADVLFLELLSPFEVTHRDCRDTHRRLHRLITEQGKRNQVLAVINGKLTVEIRRRKLTEKALRQSELHFRKLFDEARAMEDGLRDLSNKVLDVQEDERKRLSRELHDQTGQALTAISVALASLARSESFSSTGQRRLRDAQELLQSTMQTIHNFARDLRPAMLEELGLLPTLRSYLMAFAERTGLRIEFRANPVAEELPPDAKIVLFRVAQESLTNVANHAQAQRVDFRIRKVHNRIRMIISDDGKSDRPKPPDSLKTKQQLGLLGMQERVRLVNGQVAIRPQLGKGTTVNVEVPLQANGTPVAALE